MKSSNRWVVCVTCIGLVLSPAFASSITGDEGAILTDVHNKVDKRVKVGSEKDVWGEVCTGKLGDLLPEGTQLATGNRSWAQISWPMVTTRIWEESLVSIAPNKKIVNLREGEMLFNLDKRHKVSENYEVWTKLLQARVHGTTFIVQSTADFSRVAVLEGNLDVLNRLDNSIVNVGPGVIYEVRTGAGPGANWVKPVNYKANNRAPEAFPVQGVGYSAAPHQASNYPNARMTQDCPENMTEDEMKAKAYRMANNDPQKLAYYFEKIRMYQENKRKNEMVRGQNSGVNNFMPPKPNAAPAKFEPIVPLVDTSEFAPLKFDKSTSSKRGVTELKGKDSFVDELGSKAAPPLSLFRSGNAATNLYLADVDKLWQNKLVQGFSEKLPSLALVRDELYSLSPIAKSKDYFDNSPQTIKKRNELFANRAHVVRGPEGSTPGREMANALTLPGQANDSIAQKKPL